MKHGDKAKAKAAKAKAAGKKSRGKVAARSKASPRHAAKSKKQPTSKNTAVSKSGIAHRGGNGKTRPRGGAVETIAFTNPIVAAAFKRAVKKFPTAFRRLAD